MLLLVLRLLHMLGHRLLLELRLLLLLLLLLLEELLTLMMLLLLHRELAVVH